ncbi:hypothetical protein Tco_0869557 [Tanacetum coccineum]
MVQESLEDAVLAKESSQLQSSYEVATTPTEFALKKILIDKMDKTKKIKIRSKTLPLDLTKGLKKRTLRIDEEPTKILLSQWIRFEVPRFRDMPQDQEGGTWVMMFVEPKEKVESKRDWFIKPTQPQEPSDPEWNVDKTLQQGQN